MFERAVFILVWALGVPSIGWAADQGETEGWQSLFNGRDLAGWRASEHPGSITVHDGAILCNGPRAHLFYEGENGEARFKNFEFRTEVLSQAGANSGIYFHTQYQESGWPAKGYEIQVNNSAGGDGGYLERKKTGSLYGVRNIYKAMAEDGEWFELRFSVEANRVQVRVNGLLVVDYRQPQNPVRDDTGRERGLSSGTFALQCHDPGSRVMFRNLYVRPLPDSIPHESGPASIGDEIPLASLYAANFPVVDFHAHLKGGLTAEEVVQKFLNTGINYGVAVNCGLGFSVTNDAGISAFLESMRGYPVFIGMQAEGREWPRLFSSAALKKFDYVFTDSMTFTDDQGRRTRLWIKDEVEVGEPQAFMDMLVSRTVGILNNEPIDIYVNPTYLPEVLAADYDVLWTPQRMQRVIAAAVNNGVAIEINDRFQLPSIAFIRLAKAAGAKFTFGTNNGGRDDLGELSYCLQMQQECGLEWQDMFVPASRDAER